MIIIFFLSDFQAVLKLEPGNKQAKVELVKVEKVSMINRKTCL